jgi:D-tyrosyl-tRNA(Tyr) deacylase
LENSLAGLLKIRTVVQRSVNAEVMIDGISRGILPSGLLLLLGFSQEGDALPAGTAEWFESATAHQRAELLQPLFQKWWDKLAQLRIFPDEQGRMNLSLLQQPQQCGVYLVSQFTLFADLRKGNRPGFSAALSAPVAKQCFAQMVEFVTAQAAGRPVLSGVFAADMKVTLTNDGPVTLLFDCSMNKGIVAL